ncbi:MAG TPA: HD domain-containing phosphohydrolase [bacterium]|nr:HD domain-containing phosphohydrolase [bacterium]
MPVQAPPIRLSDVLSALSSALDLAEGQPAGHTVRTGLIGMRLADELALDAAARSALYYALLLANAGGPGTAAEVTALLDGDDRALKAGFATVDWTHAVAAARYGLRHAGEGRPVWSRTRAVVRTAGAVSRVARAFVSGRADRGGAVARRLGLPEATAEAIRSADEQWDGHGHPIGTRGEAIPPLARIVGLARTVDVFATAGGAGAAVRMTRARRGKWFDPALADRVAAWEGDELWWAGLRGSGAAARLAAAEPRDRIRMVDDAGLDEIARAFAGIVDSKRAWTAGHSARVGALAASIGAARGADAAGRRRLLRAGLLHDIGELGVANRALDESDALTPAEFTEIKQHTLQTYEILSKIPAFADFARLAALHHERLDGSGYPWGLSGDEIGPEARVLAVAEVYDALTIWRPYRSAMTPEEALMLMRSDAGLDHAVISALEEHLGAEGRAGGQLPADTAAGHHEM